MTSLVASLVAVALCLLTVSVWLLRRRKRVQLAEQQSQRHASSVGRVAAQRNGTTIELESTPIRIAPSRFATVEQPALEDEAAKNPEGSYFQAIPEHGVPQSEILDVEVSGNPADGGSRLDDVQDSSEVIPRNEGRDDHYVPIEAALKDVEPQVAVQALTAAPDNASPQETVPLAQISADVLVLEPKSTTPAVAESGDERPRDEAILKTADDDLRQDIAQRPEEIARELPRYRPPVQKTPQPAREKARTVSEDRAASSTSSTIELGIRVHLTFDRIGISSIGLLPERTAGLDSEVPVKLGGKPFLLLGQDDWYEDLYPEDAGVYLRNGVELKAVLAGERRVRWLLSGRDLYVLASSKLARGFVSTNRLALGRSHVVLCAAELLEKTEALLVSDRTSWQTRARQPLVFDLIEPQ
jgi:hypothetical protein